MGAILGAVRFAGSIMAGIGGCAVAESAVLTFGRIPAFANSKIISACVDVAALTAGGAAFTWTCNSFNEQWDEAEDTVERLKELKKKWQEHQEEKRSNTDLEYRKQKEEEEEAA